MANHLDYLEETGMTASEWEKATIFLARNSKVIMETI